MQPIPGICARVYVSEETPHGVIPTPESLLTLADRALGPYEAIHEQASTSYLRHYNRLKQGLQLRNYTRNSTRNSRNSTRDVRSGVDRGSYSHPWIDVNGHHNRHDHQDNEMKEEDDNRSDDEGEGNGDRADGNNDRGEGNNGDGGDENRVSENTGRGSLNTLPRRVRFEGLDQDRVGTLLTSQPSPLTSHYTYCGIGKD